MSAQRRCAFAAVRLITDRDRSWETIDYLTLAESPEAAANKARRLGDEYVGPVVRIAAVVIEERRTEMHDTMERVHERMHGR